MIIDYVHLPTRGVIHWCSREIGQIRHVAVLRPNGEPNLVEMALIAAELFTEGGVGIGLKYSAEV